VSHHSLKPTAPHPVKKAIFSAVFASFLIAFPAQAAPSGGSGANTGFQPQTLRVPEGGSTIALLGLSLIGLSKWANSLNRQKRAKADS
jgi:hypothetical protein